MRIGPFRSAVRFAYRFAKYNRHARGSDFASRYFPSVPDWPLYGAKGAVTGRVSAAAAAVGVTEMARRMKSMAGRKRKAPVRGGVSKRRKTGPVKELKRMRRMNAPLKRVVRKRTNGGMKRVNKAVGETTFLRGAMKVGRARPKISVNQLRKVATTRVVTRYQNIASVDRVANERGAHWLGPMYVTTNVLNPVTVTGNRSAYVDNQSTTSGAVTPEFLRCGFHLYCLNKSGLKPAVNPVGVQPFINMTTGAVSFGNLNVINNSDPAGVGQVFNWQAERASATYGSEMKYIRNDWYDIRLNLRNASEQTTYFDIYVVQFKEDFLDPFEETTSADEVEDRKSFYQGMARMGYANPMFPQPNMKQPLQKVRILRKMRVGFSKQYTTETDTSPEMKFVHLFIRDGRVYDYQYTAKPPSSGLPLEANVLGTSWVPQGIFGSDSDVPISKARIWLIVQAYDPRLASAVGGAGDDIGAYDAANTTAKTPSYDICLRKSETLYSAA